MTDHSDHGHPADELPTGVASVSRLEPGSGPRWDHLYLPPGLKERLVNHAVVALLHRERLSPVRGAPRGLLLFVGPPGTGKSTAARGLAAATAGALAPHGGTTLVEVDPHELPSDLLGQSQRNVVRLLARTLPKVAATSRFTVVVVDELEAFATSRKAASFETNPADLHRATDAVLLGLDQLAARQPHLLFVATTNFPEAVDAALLSRVDLLVPFELPDRDLVAGIVRDTLDELATAWPTLGGLATSAVLVEHLADLCKGLDGRQIRKLAVTALANRAEVARDPSRLTAEDLVAAASALGREAAEGSP